MHESLEIEIWGLGIVSSAAREQGAAGHCRLCGQVAAGVDLEKKEKEKEGRGVGGVEEVQLCHFRGCTEVSAIANEVCSL